MDYLSKNVRFLSSLPGLGQLETEKAGILGQSGVNKIANGKTKEAGYRTVANLAQFYGVSIDALVLSDIEAEGIRTESQATGLDTTKLTELIETVEAAIAESGRTITARTKAKLLSMLYTDDRAAAATPEAIQAALRGILLSLEDPS